MKNSAPRNDLENVGSEVCSYPRFGCLQMCKPGQIIAYKFVFL